MTQSKRKYCPYCGHRTLRYYSPKSVAFILDVSLETIRKWIARREISYRKIGRLIRISSQELERIGKYFPSFNDDNLSGQ